MLRVLLTSVRFGDVHAEVLHQSLEVLLQKVFPGNFENAQRHLKDGLDALEQKNVENAKNLKTFWRNNAFLLIISLIIRVDLSCPLN